LRAADALADAILQGSTATLPPPMGSQLGGDGGLDAGLPPLLAGPQPSWHQPHALPSVMGAPPAQPQRAWHNALLNGPGLPPLQQQPAPQLTPSERLAAAELLGDLGGGEADELEAVLLAELAAPQLDETRICFKVCARCWLGVQRRSWRCVARVCGPLMLLSHDCRVARCLERQPQPPQPSNEFVLLLMPQAATPSATGPPGPRPPPSPQLYGARPEQLPPQLRSELLTALCLPGTAVQATLRAGCVHLTLTALLSAEERAALEQPGAAASALARLLPLASQLPARRILAQVGTSSAAFLAAPRDGRPAALFSVPLGGATGSTLPHLVPVSPIATTVSAAGGRFRLRCPRALLLGGGGASLHCRVGGRHVAVALTLVGAAPHEPPDDDSDSAEEHALNGSVAASMDTGGGSVAADTQQLATNGGGAALTAGSLPEQAVASLGLPDHGGNNSDDFEGAEEAADLDEVVEVDVFVAGPMPADVGAEPAPSFWQAGWGLYEFEACRGGLSWTRVCCRV
jgi:hypothetical protein